MKTSQRLLTFLIGFGLLIGSCQSSDEENDQPSQQSPQPQGTSKDAPLNTLTEAEKDEGWKLLFDGASLEGWHSYNSQKPGDAWKVEKGAIKFDPKNNENGGDLTTDKEYKDFELLLEWKISPKGNSGIFFDVNESQEYNAAPRTGPEIQLLDNDNAKDNELPSHLAGALYDMIPVSAEAAKPANEWNKIRIRKDEGQLTAWLNTNKTVDIQMQGERWRKLLNDSKFSDWEGFGKYSSGHIALQDHGHIVWFRDIKIKEL